MTQSKESGGYGGGMRTPPGRPMPGLFPPSESLRPTVVGTRYAVSAGHPLVAQAAAAILDQGGNAIDAGVAGGLVANVVQADMANFGGIAPTVVRTSAGEMVSISGVGVWSRDISLQKFLARYGGDIPLGMPAAIVPAAPDAWITALSSFGTYSFNQVVASAVRFAEEGFALDARTASSLKVLSGGFRQWASSCSIYYPNGIEPHVGQVLRQPALARLLRAMAAAERGPTRRAALDNVRRYFYEGEPAELIVRAVGAGGGWMNLEDLRSFHCEVDSPVAFPYGNYVIHTPGTWTQGPALLIALGILDRLGLRDIEHNSAEYIHLTSQAIRVAMRERETFRPGPEPAPDVAQILSAEAIDRQVKQVVASELDSSPGDRRPTRRRADTTYLCVVDGDGNAFSSTPSDTLDGGPIIPELGIIVSPRGVQSWVDPKHPAVLAPGKRPRVTPAPALAVERDSGAHLLAFGSPGGDVIAQAMLQVFLNAVHFRMTLQQAVEAPRFGVFGFPNSFHPHSAGELHLRLEQRLSDEVAEAVSRNGYPIFRWGDWDFDAGGVSIVGDVARADPGVLILGGGADPRRSCYAMAR